MEQIAILDIVSFLGLFLLGISLVQMFSHRTSFPFTVALLILGAIAQLANLYIQTDIPFSLSHTFVYYLLLPILLYEAAFHINIHQFRLQFKTISFISSFGLLVSVFVVGIGLAVLIGLPFPVAILFGALISATDPIAVLALFNTLGAPKRLALIADGESMFNDATAVIAFKIVSLFAVSQTIFEPKHVLIGAWEFVTVFILSIVVGAILGLCITFFISKIRQDKLIVNSIIAAVVLGGFVFIDHTLHLSGVISIVIAGIFIGNFGKTKFDHEVTKFMKEFWGYLSFLGISYVFFFATFSLDFSFLTNSLPLVGATIAVVLIARAVSVYVSFFLSNRLKFFQDEPNVPLTWQHILCWGGLRGVIPLVLVYTLPDTFAYKDQILTMTFGVLLFTLLVNGVTIKYLLLALKLHIPKKEELLMGEEQSILALEERRNQLLALKDGEFDPTIKREIESELAASEKSHQELFRSLANAGIFYKCLKLQAIAIERKSLSQQFAAGYIPESAYSQFEMELDLQEDAIDYEEVLQGRGYSKGGLISARSSYRLRLAQLRTWVHHFPTVSKLLGISPDYLRVERYALLRARIEGIESVFVFLDKVEQICETEEMRKEVAKVRELYQQLHKENEVDILSMNAPNDPMIREYQSFLLRKIVRI